MPTIDLLNRFGRNRWLRPLSRTALLTLPKVGLGRLTRIAGRRLVAASAFNPAAIQTCGDIERSLKDPRALFEAMRYTIDEMKLDILCLPADLTIEAEACGCHARFAKGEAPAVDSHPIEDLGDVSRLKIPDPCHDGRLPVILESLRLLKRSYSIITAAPVIGPFTLAMQLRGSSVFTDTLRSPDRLETLLEYCAATVLTYGKALVAAGADMIIVAEPAMSQMSRGAYDRFSRPYTNKIAHSIGKPCTLHICGKTDHLVRSMGDSPMAGISIDDVDIASVVDQVPRRTVVVGNISPLFLRYKNPEEVRQKTMELLGAIRNKKEFLVAPGCDLAPETPLKNILAFVETVKAWR